MTTEVSVPDSDVMEVADALRPLTGNASGRVALVGAPAAECWSAALSDLLEPGARLLAASGDRDTQRWAEHLRGSGFEVVRGSAEWGEPPSAEEISYLLWWDPSIRAVFVNHGDLESGATADLGRIRQAMDDAGSTALLLVEMSGTLGIVEVRQDDWRVDVAVSGSDRGLMNPPGATVVSLSSRAAAAADRRASYPPVSDPFLHGLRAALDAIFDEGLDNVLHRHTRVAAAVRAAVASWGLRTLGPLDGSPSSASTTMLLPSGVDAQELSTACHREFGTRIAPCSSRSGDGAVDAVVWQHHGDYTEARCLVDVAAVELVLARLGHVVQLGAGLAAAALRLEEGRALAAP